MNQNPWVQVGAALKQKDFRQAVAAVTTKEARGFFAKTAITHSAKTLAVTAAAVKGTVAAGRQFRTAFDEIVQQPADRPKAPAKATQTAAAQIEAPPAPALQLTLSAETTAPLPAAAPEPVRTSYKELQAQCKEHGVSAKGSAAMLQERLAGLNP
jgi:hypothetical protein